MVDGLDRLSSYLDRDGYRELQVGIADVVKLMRGKPGSSITLELQRR